MKISGMIDESMDKDQLKKEPEPWELRSKPAYQRLIVMLGGVAFFSYIMSNFIEILSSYDAKMGILDKSDDLSDWLISLERFISKKQGSINDSLI